MVLDERPSPSSATNAVTDSPPDAGADSPSNDAARPASTDSTDHTAENATDEAVREAVALSDGGEDSSPTAEETYDVVYRATRDAVWDVVGTATLIVFHLLLAAITFTVAYNGLRELLSGSPSPVAVGIGLVGLGVALFSTYRVYALATE